MYTIPFIYPGFGFTGKRNDCPASFAMSVVGKLTSPKKIFVSTISSSRVNGARDFDGQTKRLGKEAARKWFQHLHWEVSHEAAILPNM
jgi:hypothetical protein